MLKLKLPVLWTPDAKKWLIRKDPDAGKDWRQEEKGTTEDEMVSPSPTRWTWVWVNSGSRLWTGRPGVLQFMSFQSQTRLSNWTELSLHCPPRGCWRALFSSFSQIVSFCQIFWWGSCNSLNYLRWVALFGSRHRLQKCWTAEKAFLKAVRGPSLFCNLIPHRVGLLDFCQDGGTMLMG